MGLPLSYFVYFRQLFYYTAICYNCFLSFHYCQTIRQAFLPNRLSAAMILPSLSPTPKSQCMHSGFLLVTHSENVCWASNLHRPCADDWEQGTRGRRAQLHGAHGFAWGRLVRGGSADESDSLHARPQAWPVVTQEGTAPEAEFAWGTRDRGQRWVCPRSPAAASSEGASEG